MILALETATRACSAALFAPSGELLGQRHAEDGPAHTQLLLPFVHAILAKAVAYLAQVVKALETYAGVVPGPSGASTARACWGLSP